MFPRHITIFFAVLASCDVAFGRIGSSEPNVFAPRPIGNSSNPKAGDKGKNGRGLLQFGVFDKEIERNFKMDTRGKVSEMNSNQYLHWDGKDSDETHDEKQAKGTKKYAHQQHGHGKLRKLAVEEKRKAVDLSKNFVVEEPINLWERLKSNGGII